EERRQEIETPGNPGDGLAVRGEEPPAEGAEDGESARSCAEGLEDDEAEDEGAEGVDQRIAEMENGDASAAEPVIRREGEHRQGPVVLAPHAERGRRPDVVAEEVQQAGEALEIRIVDDQVVIVPNGPVPERGKEGEE